MCSKLSYFWWNCPTFQQGILLYFSIINWPNILLYDIISDFFFSLGENKEDKTYRKYAEHLSRLLCSVPSVFLIFYYFINIRLSTRKHNVKSSLFFSHALHLNKLIKALYRNLLSQIKLRTGNRYLSA